MTLRRRRAFALLAVLTLVWGTNWPLMPLATREVSVWTFRAIGSLSAGVLLLAIASTRGQSLRVRREDWLAVGAASIAYLLVWNLASAYAAILIPSGQAAVLGFTMPFWAALLSWLLFGERPGARMALAIALGAASVALLMAPNFGVYAQAPRGLAMGLLAAIGWAVGTLILKRHAPAVPASVLTAWQLVVSGVPIAIGAMLLGDGRWFMPSGQTVAVIAWIAVVPMALGNLCWFAIVGLLPANVAGLSSIMVPVVALVSGAIVHGEPLGILQWLAMACSVAALSLALLARPAGARG
ncbi:MAG TPA: DMT family transporter [Burkholderiaceae bacterium]|nr:DMT family transporter [Burkholderiaceae bacterium]HRA77975.1 DMT family transporter [Burkholderiaceae bacterium]